jgi:hypothetical protein
MVDTFCEAHIGYFACHTGRKRWKVRGKSLDVVRRGIEKRRVESVGWQTRSQRVLENYKQVNRPESVLSAQIMNSVYSVKLPPQGS